MSVSALANVSSHSCSSSTESSPWAAFRKSYRGLESALLNGDVSGAQSALAALQQAAGGVSAAGRSPLAQLGQPDSTLGKDLAAISSALDSGDLGAAQKAFATFQQDLDAARQAGGMRRGHHGHHRHHGDDGATATSGSPAAQLEGLLQSLGTAAGGSSGASDLNGALQQLAQSNPKLASDLVTLIQDLNGTGAVVDTRA